MPGLSKRAQQKIERHAEILEAALDEFVARGYLATRLEDVAARIGVTKGTVHFYFGTKEALFAAVIRHYAPVLGPDETSNEDTETDKPSFDRIADYLAILHAAIATDGKTREIFHLLMSDGRHFPDLIDRYFEEFLAPAVEHLRALIKVGIKRGELRASALERFPEILLGPSVLANIWSAVFGSRRPLDQAAFLRVAFDVLRNGAQSAS